MDALEGIVFFGFSNFRVLPRNNDDFIGINVSLDSTALQPSPLIGLGEKSIVSLRVIPNPTSGIVRIDWAGPALLRAEIIDFMGRTLWVQPLSQGHDILDLQALASGTYWVRIEGAQGEKHLLKVLLQR